MIIWKKKLIRCCKCGKAYSFDDNLFYHLKEYILICPNCNLTHKVDIQLLGKEYEGLKKIDKLNLTAIDIGNLAEDRSNVTTGNWTLVCSGVTATGTGKITTVEIYCAAQMAGAKAATFSASGNDLTARDSEVLNNGNGAGVVLTGFQSFTVDLDVILGDVLGIYMASGSLDRTGGSDANITWYLAGDQTACSGATFSVQDRLSSIHGTGATEEEASTDNAITFGMNF